MKVFTAVDDCTRMRVLGLYSTRSSKNAIRFLLDKMLPQFPGSQVSERFPVQRIQSDRGQEFLSMDFQDALREHCIKAGETKFLRFDRTVLTLPI